ncbi:MAG: glycosyltransferase family 2 protein [Spirosomataceae bacterium]
MENPLVSIITVNFNQTQVTLELLASLQKISYSPIEVWVVDNGSKEDPQSVIQDAFPEVRVIRSNQNLGFAGGNNLAITQANGQYFMFLNNDTEVQTDFLEPLVEHMEKHKSTGVCASKLRFFHGEQRIQFAGSTPLHPVKIQSFALGFGQRNEEYVDQAQPTHLAHGAAMMVRSSVITAVGLMPEEYFLYYEEIDWCERIKEAGYQIWYIPNSVVFHKESMSVGKQSPLQVYYKTRNRIWLAKKWRKGWTLKKSMAYLAIAGIRDYLRYSFKRQWPLAKSVWKAWRWHLSPSN